jgi:hypothetical protein
MKIKLEARIEIHHHDHSDDDAPTLAEIVDMLGEIAADQTTANEGIAKLLAEHAPVGIEVVPGVPTTRTERSPVRPFNPLREFPMKCTLIKLSKGTKKSSKRAAAGDPVVEFQLQDNGDDSCTVLGVDAAGNTMDISAVATLTPAPTSDNASIITVDGVVGMSFDMHAVGPIGTANVTAVATWNDGSVGPFTFTLPVRTQAGPANAIQIVPGTPTVH